MLTHSTNMELKQTFQSNKLLWPYLGQYFAMIDSMQSVSFFTLPIQTFKIGEALCLSFSYFTSTNDGKLNVYIKKDNNVNQLVWMSTTPSKYAINIGSNWKTEFIDINSQDITNNYGNFEILFEIVRSPNQIEEIAIDDIEIEKTMCIAKKYNIF